MSGGQWSMENEAVMRIIQSMIRIVGSKDDVRGGEGW